MKLRRIFILMFTLVSFTFTASSFSNVNADENVESVEEVLELEEGYIPVVKDEETNEYYLFVDYVEKYQQALEKLANEVTLEVENDINIVLQIHEIKANGKNVLANITIEDYELVEVLYQAYAEKLDLILVKKDAIEDIQKHNDEKKDEFGFVVGSDIASYILLINNATTEEEVEEVALNAEKEITIFFEVKQNALDRLDTYLEYGVNEEDINEIKENIIEATTTKEIEFIINTFETVALTEVKEEAIEKIESYVSGYEKFIDSSVYVKLINAATTIEQVEAELIVAYAAIDAVKQLQAEIKIKLENAKEKAIETINSYIELLEDYANKAELEAKLSLIKALETLEEVEEILTNVAKYVAKVLLEKAEDKASEIADIKVLEYAKTIALAQLNEYQEKYTNVDFASYVETVEAATSIKEVQIALVSATKLAAKCELENQIQNAKLEAVETIRGYVDMVRDYIDLNSYNEKINEYINNIEASKTLEEVKSNLSVAVKKVVCVILSSYDIYGDKIADILDKIDVNADAIEKLQNVLFTKDSNGKTLIENIANNTEAITALQNMLFTEDENGMTIIDYIGQNANTIQALVDLLNLDENGKSPILDAIIGNKEAIDTLKDLLEIDENGKSQLLEIITGNKAAIETLKELLKLDEETGKSILDEIANNKAAVETLNDLLLAKDENGKTLVDYISENKESIKSLQDLFSGNDDDINSLDEKIQMINEIIADYDTYKTNINELGKLVEDLQDTIKNINDEKDPAYVLENKKNEAVEEFKSWIIAYLNVLVEEYKAKHSLLAKKSSQNLSISLATSETDQETIDDIISLLNQAGFEEAQINEFIKKYNQAIEEISSAQAIEDIQPKLDLFKEDLRQYTVNIVKPEGQINFTGIYVVAGIICGLLIVVIALLVVLIVKKNNTNNEVEDTKEENTLLNDDEILIRENSLEETQEIEESDVKKNFIQ